MTNPNVKQATLLRIVDANGATHTLLCHPDVTLIAVQSYVSDNLATPCKIADMIGCQADLSLTDHFGGAAPKGAVLPMIIDLTQGL